MKETKAAKKEKMVSVKYTGPVPCTILKLGKFNPGDERDIPERIARNLQHDRNWKRLDMPAGRKKEIPADPGLSKSGETEKGGK